MARQDVSERIVLLPREKGPNKTTLWIERKQVSQEVEGNVHVAGGKHSGIVVQKDTVSGGETVSPPQISLQFRVFLVNASTNTHTQEARTLGFWFKNECVEQARSAQDFFRDLVTPQDFPRDYVGFITKLMKLLQHGHPVIVRLEVILEQLIPAEMPERPCSPDVEGEKHVPLTEEKLLEIIESSYPNPITVQDVACEHTWDEAEVLNHMEDLRAKGMVKDMDHGAFTRAQHDDTQVQIVQQMPVIVKSAQPTIAIITAQYVEKLAVDAMMSGKETFVRYTTVGESHVYTLGNLGAHRVVCTKVPTVGHSREAVIAAGNTTTRLLGTFQCVEHVILVGVGGGVPHFTDATRHVRLGDVVISNTCSGNFNYIYCESAVEKTPGKFEFETKEYAPKNTVLEKAASKICAATTNGDASSWVKFMDQGRKAWGGQDYDLKRPSEDTDKLYMAINERDLIEVAHPALDNNNFNPERKSGLPRLHMGAVGSGRDIARHDLLRQQFAERYAVSAFDPEFHAVLDSVRGNCRDSFIIIRGIADYKDGTRRTEWQNYASLAAASVAKAILSAIDPSEL